MKLKVVNKNIFIYIEIKIRDIISFVKCECNPVLIAVDSRKEFLFVEKDLRKPCNPIEMQAG